MSRSDHSGELTSDEMNATMMDPEFNHPGCCYFGSGFNCWQRVRVGSEESWVTSGWKKVREWSELVAGPRWKTFIRKFGRNRAGAGGQGKFGYDPLSYALNFDDGQNGQLDEDLGARDFSTRYAFPVSAKSSMDLGRDGPSFT